MTEEGFLSCFYITESFPLFFPLTRKIPHKKNVLIRDENRLDEYVLFEKMIKKLQLKPTKYNSNLSISARKTPFVRWTEGVFIFLFLDNFNQISGFTVQIQAHSEN